MAKGGTLETIKETQDQLDLYRTEVINNLRTKDPDQCYEKVKKIIEIRNSLDEIMQKLNPNKGRSTKVDKDLKRFGIYINYPSKDLGEDLKGISWGYLAGAAKKLAKGKNPKLKPIDSGIMGYLYPFLVKVFPGQNAEVRMKNITDNASQGYEIANLFEVLKHIENHGGLKTLDEIKIIAPKLGEALDDFSSEFDTTNPQPKDGDIQLMKRFSY